MTRGKRSLRAELSRLRAQLMTLLGQPRGFFTQYAYADQLQCVDAPYAEVESLFANCGYEGFFDEILNHCETLSTLGMGPNDPVLGRGMFPALDGMAAYAAIRRFRPGHIIEIGSGDSTFFLARAIADAGHGRITCIDPQPRRDVLDLEVGLERRLLANNDAALAASLEPNDVLFIDSSHIMLPGMDVDIQFNRMFPRLQKSVLVHVHDIFLPDDYPPHWRERNYSEQNALMGWILSGFFEVLWPGHYVFTRRKDFVSRVGEFAEIRGAGSIWLRKT